ncbi:unnamed protein product, partial [Mesorhabditis belari]|uniref:Uncharacterized protein n=1 Tax=Mesorhabditis belari TaxID=2138241 RepID=A0AAF3ERW7_9BILA
MSIFVFSNEVEYKRKCNPIFLLLSTRFTQRTVDLVYVIKSIFCLIALILNIIGMMRALSIIDLEESTYVFLTADSLSTIFQSTLQLIYACGSAKTLSWFPSMLSSLFDALHGVYKDHLGSVMIFSLFGISLNLYTAFTCDNLRKKQWQQYSYFQALIFASAGAALSILLNNVDIGADWENQSFFQDLPWYTILYGMYSIQTGSNFVVYRKLKESHHTPLRVICLGISKRLLAIDLMYLITNLILKTIGVLLRYTDYQDFCQFLVILIDFFDNGFYLVVVGLLTILFVRQPAPIKPGEQQPLKMPYSPVAQKKNKK